MFGYNYIVIEGIIGSGKTTLAKMLSEEFNGNLVLEKFEDNPFLPKFGLPEISVSSGHVVNLFINPRKDDEFQVLRSLLFLA